MREAGAEPKHAAHGVVEHIEAALRPLCTAHARARPHAAVRAAAGHVAPSHGALLHPTAGRGAACPFSRKRRRIQYTGSDRLRSRGLPQRQVSFGLLKSSTRSAQSFTVGRRVAPAVGGAAGDDASAGSPGPLRRSAASFTAGAALAQQQQARSSRQQQQAERLRRQASGLGAPALAWTEQVP